MDDKQKILYESCLEAGSLCALQSFENVVSAWLEERNMKTGFSIYEEESISEFMDHYEAWIGFPTKDDVEVNFADQSSEYLFGGNQADVIYIDENVFPEFNGENHWAVLDKYFGSESVPIVEKAFEEGLQSFFKKYFKDSKSPVSSILTE